MKRTLLPLVLFLALSTSAMAGPAGPVNLGSGDLAYTIPLFAIGQDPLPLSFSLTYHSSELQEPSLVPWPLGVGWTHSFNQVLVARDGAGALLYHVNGSGEETTFLLSDVGIWRAANPLSERGQVTLVTDATKCAHSPANQCYVLTDLQGSKAWFDYDGTTAGRWRRTEDRWGNAIGATYSGTNLTVITDSVGRVVTLSYDGSNHLTGILLAPQGQTGPTWTLGYTSGRLESIRDPMHTSTFWRTLSYVTDSQSVQRLLSTVRDDGPYLLDGFEYLNDQVAWQNAEGTSHAVHYVYGTITDTNPKTRVTTVTRKQTASVDMVTTYTLEYRGGRWLATTIEGGCSSCGAGGSDKVVYTYDSTNLRPATKTVGRDLSGSGGTDERAQARFTYDANGMVLTRREAFGKTEERTTTYDYAYASGSPSGGSPWPAFVTSVTEASVGNPGQGKVTTYTWNDSGTPETTLTVSVSGYQNPLDSGTVLETTTLFDTRHRRTTVTGPATNQKSTFSYFADDNAETSLRGRLQTAALYTSAAARLDTQYSDYDVFGAARKVVDPNLVETTRETDDVGRVTSVTSEAVSGDANEASDYTTTYEYDLHDRLVQVTHPRGNQVQYVYENGTNRLTDTIRADSSGVQHERLHLTLNLVGGKTGEEAQRCEPPSSSCANWVPKRTETFEYNTSNRLSSVVHPGSPTSRIDYTYDSRGNLKTVKDERHTTANTTYAYDFLNRLTTVTQTLAGATGGQIATGYEYDSQDNLKSVTDPNNNATTYAYDDFRLLRKQTSPVTGVTEYDYYDNGDLKTVTDARGATTTRTYDAASRITTAVSTMPGRADETVSYAYDGGDPLLYLKGRLASMTDPTGRTLYTYDRRGLVKTERKSVLSATYETSYGYDANGNRTSVTYPGAAYPQPGNVVTYAFDFADRPYSATGGATTYVSTATYMPFGPLWQLGMGNGLTREMTYNQRYQPATLRLLNGGTSIADYTYSPDAGGNILSIADNMNSAYSRTDLRYDDLNRLTRADSGGSLWGTGTSYSYDKMGSITSLTLGSRTATFSYLPLGAGDDKLPVLEKVTENSVDRAVSYDAAGNETSVGGRAFTYSPRNYLQSAADRAAADESFYYMYDGRGLRTATVDTKAGSSIVVTNVSPGALPATAGATQVTVDGFPFQRTSVVYVSGTPLPTTFVSSTRLTATVSASDLLLNAYTPLTVRDGAAVSNSYPLLREFADVPAGAPFDDFINTLLYNRVTNGNGVGVYGPTANVNRAQMAVFIMRAVFGADYVPPACTQIFEDVPCTGTLQYMAPFINDFKNRGYTDGCGPEGGPLYFCPLDDVNRAAMAKFLLKGKHGGGYLPPSDTVSLFTDIPAGWEGFIPWINQLAREGITSGCGVGLFCPTQPVNRASMAAFLTRAFALRPAGTTSPASGHRFHLYDPEYHLLTETEYQTTAAPAPMYEYVWFGGQLVATKMTGSDPGFVTTDHLGTPFLVTGPAPAKATLWWGEYEPYGRIFSRRAGNPLHQPLRLPGQEAEQLSTAETSDNGATERSYNIFRWYRPGWGRYSQPDPIFSVPDLSPRLKGLFDTGELNPFLYARGNPTVFRDPLGLCSVCDDCPSGEWTAETVPVLSAVFATPWGGIGGSRSYATLRCKDNGRTVEVLTRCRVLEGIYIGGGIGFSGTPFGAKGACGCNVSDLLSPSTSSTLSLSIAAWDRGPCSSGGHTNAFGVGLSLRGGVAQFACETILTGKQLR